MLRICWREEPGQILKDRSRSIQSCYLGDNKGPRKRQLMKEINGMGETRYTLFLKCAHFQSVTDSSAYKLSSYRTRQFCNTGYSVQREGADSTTRSANAPTPPSTSPLQGLFFLNSCFLVYSLYFCFGCYLPSRMLTVSRKVSFLLSP